jgi:3-methyladenine DNA glycosylase AlkD
MASVSSVLSELKSLGTQQTLKTWTRHGTSPGRAYGVSLGDLKGVAKKLKGEQELACKLFETSNLEAMYLAGLVADGSRLTKKQLENFAAASAGLPMISDTTVPWLAVEHADARELAVKWIKSKAPHVATCGWCTYAGLVAVEPDGELNLEEIKKLLAQVRREVTGAHDRVRYYMNKFVISVGTHVKALHEEAKKTAIEMGAITVDMGDTACTVPSAVAAIEKAKATTKLGKKRKTLRC